MNKDIINKNLFCILAALFMPLLQVQAEDALQVAPTTLLSGLTQNDYEYTFSINMNCTEQYTAIQFDMYLPAGVSLIDDEPAELSPDRFDGIMKKGVFMPNHTVDITRQTDVDGHYLVIVYDEDLGKIKGSTGELMRFYYLTSAEMAQGVYPVKISNVKLAVDSHNGVYPAASASYFRIGNPQNATLALEGNIPSFVNDSLAVDSSIGLLDLSAVTSMAGTFKLIDGRGLVQPATSFTVPEIQYTRIMANDWGTVCLPFNVVSDSNVKFYTLETASMDKGILTFEQVGSVNAGTPALLKKCDSSAGEVSINVTNATLSNSDVLASMELTGSKDWSMNGSYTAISLNPADKSPLNVYYIAENKFWHADKTFSIGTFRAWFETTSVRHAPSYMSITESGPETGIGHLVYDSNGTGPVYDMSGNRHETLQNGKVYIVNGKKLIIR